MAGERNNSTTANSESRASSVPAGEEGNAKGIRLGGGGDQQQQQQQPSPHSRVGGIQECGPLGNKDPLHAQDPHQDQENDICRYAAGQTASGMSFIELCQVNNHFN